MVFLFRQQPSIGVNSDQFITFTSNTPFRATHFILSVTCSCGTCRTLFAPLSLQLSVIRPKGALPVLTPVRYLPTSSRTIHSSTRLMSEQGICSAVDPLSVVSVCPVVVGIMTEMSSSCGGQQSKFRSLTWSSLFCCKLD